MIDKYEIHQPSLWNLPYAPSIPHTTLGAVGALAYNILANKEICTISACQEHYMPVEIWSHIFSYLPLEEVVCCAFINQECYTIAISILSCCVLDFGYEAENILQLSCAIKELKEKWKKLVEEMHKKRSEKWCEGQKCVKLIQPVVALICHTSATGTLLNKSFFCFLETFKCAVKKSKLSKFKHFTRVHQGDLLGHAFVRHNLLPLRFFTYRYAAYSTTLFVETTSETEKMEMKSKYQQVLECAVRSGDLSAIKKLIDKDIVGRFWSWLEAVDAVLCFCIQWSALPEIMDYLDVKDVDCLLKQKNYMELIPRVDFQKHPVAVAWAGVLIAKGQNVPDRIAQYFLSLFGSGKRVRLRM